MGYAELIERLQALPQDKQAEVFDFVEFLSLRSGVAEIAPQAQAEWVDGEFAHMAMGQAWRGIEDDPVGYTASDLRERWQ
ncbi:MAG: DUF2281 domain-containing protein [Rhodocyclales bacterium]|nr:DUF2281 domain-containing protein [Rhodocyclales bacterium]